jgi:hypothetical protein
MEKRGFRFFFSAQSRHSRQRASELSKRYPSLRILGEKDGISRMTVKPSTRFAHPAPTRVCLPGRAEAGAFYSRPP